MSTSKSLSKVLKESTQTMTQQFRATRPSSSTSAHQRSPTSTGQYAGHDLSALDEGPDKALFPTKLSPEGPKTVLFLDVRARTHVRTSMKQAGAPQTPKAVLGWLRRVSPRGLGLSTQHAHCYCRGFQVASDKKEAPCSTASGMIPGTPRRRELMGPFESHG